MGTLVNYVTEKGVALLTLTDPPVNAYTHEMFKELDACILEARFDDDIHVVVVTGHGEEYFCAGENVHMLREADENFTYYFCLHANETLLRLENTPKLVVAAINGHCIGGGFELALACDIRIARGGPFEVGLPQVGLGLMPGLGGTQRLPRLVGKARATELIVEGTSVDVDTAQELGLVHKVWSTDTHDEFMRRIFAYARDFCPPRRSPCAVGQIKRALQASSEELERGIILERELQQRLIGSSDAKEGLAAFIQKREPSFRDR
ncbi:MAG TPA: enoyl-CoA hydratase/isomerase family protein [Polyangiaceae bacterium]|jgi:enoyl-CoA hydratase/carnithine racemase|nr:enoyl-CoA hydratase/isomerase family protein [Polyangiaceae bacterium]